MEIFCADHWNRLPLRLCPFTEVQEYLPCSNYPSINPVIVYGVASFIFWSPVTFLVWWSHTFLLPVVISQRVFGMELVMIKPLCLGSPMGYKLERKVVIRLCSKFAFGFYSRGKRKPSPWDPVGCLPSLNLSFLFSKMGTITSSSQDCCEDPVI